MEKAAWIETTTGTFKKILFFFNLKSVPLNSNLLYVIEMGDPTRAGENDGDQQGDYGQDDATTGSQV